MKICDNILAVKNSNLRTGFTTGSASTAAILGALQALFRKDIKSTVNIIAPAGVLTIPLNYVLLGRDFSEAEVIKDGGDDPDCTHGISIIAKVYKKNDINIKMLHALKLSDKFLFYTGAGIGIVTEEGLSVNVGEPAVNPVPREMIKKNVESFLEKYNISEKPSIILEVPQGNTVAKHTLNERLGIIGGISILGTTGIVKPVSMEAFTSTIDVSLNIAKKKGLKKVVLSFGRQSELCAGKIFKLPKESFVLIGDFFKYSIDRAKSMGFEVVLSGQPGKILKSAMDIENTNVKYGAFSVEKTLEFLKEFCSTQDLKELRKAKTARHLWKICEEKGVDIWDKIAKYIANRESIEVLIFSYEGALIGRS